MTTRGLVLVSLFYAWTVLSEVPDQNNCSTLKVSGDQFINGMNGYYAPDPTLQTMYEYDKYINHTIFKHFQENRIIFFIGKPHFWVVGKAEDLYTANFWYENRNPSLIGPWYTNFYKNGPNNLSVACMETGKPKMSDSTNTLRPKIMFLVVTIKIVIMGCLLRFFA